MISNQEAQAFVLERFPGVTFQAEYPGAVQPWPMTCADGHPCQPRYNNIKAGKGICRTCDRAKRTLTDDEAKRFVLERFPGVRFRADYPGSGVPWPMVCPEGHKCQPRYNHIRRGEGICRQCRNRALSEERQLSDADARAFVLDRFPGIQFRTDYPGARVPWPMVCSEGHECQPRYADIRRGRGICRTCGLASTARARSIGDAEAKALVSERFPGTQFLIDYPGDKIPWPMVCPQGHVCQPYYCNIQRGGGVCRTCSQSGFDRLSPAYFYGLNCSFLRVMNFGISGPIGSRVADHRRAARRRGVVYQPVGMWLYSESGAVIAALEAEVKTAVRRLAAEAIVGSEDCISTGDEELWLDLIPSEVRDVASLLDWLGISVPSGCEWVSPTEALGESDRSAA